MAFFKTHSYKLNSEDLQALNDLLLSGISFKDSLELIRNTHNNETISDLNNRLSKGQLIEEIVDQYLPKDIAVYTRELIKNISFEESLGLSLMFAEKNKQNRQALSSSIAYPLFLLFVAISGLYLFDIYGFDAIISILSSFGNNLQYFSYIRPFFRLLVNIFYFAMLIIIMIVTYFASQKRIAILYIYLSQKKPDTLLQTYYSQEFVSMFLVTLKKGYKTKEALTILKALHNKPLISLLAFHLDEKLLNGISFKEAASLNYFDSTLSRFINIATYTNNFAQMLEKYVDFAQKKIKRKTKMYADILQATAYVLVGLVIVFIYQVLFMPMQIISGF